MKLITGLSAASAAMMMMSFSAYAGEMADACVAALEADGRDTSGCSCLENEVVANGLEDEFTSLGEIADPQARYDAASAEAKAAMDACTR